MEDAMITENKPFSGIEQRVNIYYDLLSKYDLKETEYCVLDVLRRGYDKKRQYCICKRSDIAKWMCVTKGSMSGYIKTLIEKKRIEEYKDGFKIINAALLNDFNEKQKPPYAQIAFQFNKHFEINVFQAIILWNIYVLKHKQKTSYGNMSIEKICTHWEINRSSFDNVIATLKRKGMVVQIRKTNKIMITDKFIADVEAIGDLDLVPKKGFGERT